MPYDLKYIENKPNLMNEQKFECEYLKDTEFIEFSIPNCKFYTSLL